MPLTLKRAQSSLSMRELATGYHGMIRSQGNVAELAIDRKNRSKARLLPLSLLRARG
jgi:hypothetical protein